MPAVDVGPYFLIRSTVLKKLHQTYVTNSPRTLLMGVRYFLKRILLKYIPLLNLDSNVIFYCRICAVQQQKEVTKTCSSLFFN